MYFFGRLRWLRRVTNVVRTVDPIKSQVRFQRERGRMRATIANERQIKVDVEESRERLKAIATEGTSLNSVIYYDPVTREPVALETEAQGLLRVRAPEALRQSMLTLPWSQDDFGFAMVRLTVKSPLKRAFPEVSPQQINNQTLNTSSTIGVVWDHIKPFFIVPVVMVAVVLSMVALVLGVASLIPHKEMTHQENIASYVTPTYSASQAIPELNDATAHLTTRWKDGKMDFLLTLSDVGPPLFKRLNDSTGHFTISWFDLDDKPMLTVTVPIQTLLIPPAQGKTSSKKTSLYWQGIITCTEASYSKIHEHNNWSLSWSF